MVVHSGWGTAMADLVAPDAATAARAAPGHGMGWRARWWRRWFQVCAACVLALAAGACASLPKDIPRKPSTALATADATPLGRLVAQSDPDPALSGFHLISSGQEAFGTLITLADHATRTLDVQYYIIEADESTREILRHVRAAAERGVRVRMLVDDLHSEGKDHAFVRFAEHPNIEVRMFNPFPAGRFSKVTRLLSSAADLRRVNRRMHNKAFIADNSLAMTGGRNMGNPYFLRAPDTNFVDLDVVAAGPAVRKLSEAFDKYWNSEFAIPVEALAGKDSQPASAPAAAPGKPEQVMVDEEAERKRFESQGMTPPAKIDPRKSFLARQLSGHGKLMLEWARATVVVDSPQKVEPDRQSTVQSETLTNELGQVLGEAKQEIILISPYLVPGERGVQWMAGMIQKGVKVRVLTNSLAATDSPIVHVGYRRYRPEMLRAGVELHELKSKPQRRESQIGDFTSSQASLHVKAAVADRKILFVGSMNFDPRSATQNTETGLIIRSPRLASAIAKLFDDVLDQTSYLVKLKDKGTVEWIDGQGDKAHALTDEPDTTWKRRMWVDLLTPLTPEELL